MNTVLVIGDLMIDTYLIGQCSRISPEAPVGVVQVNETKSVLGGAGNVLANIISLGVGANIMTVIGDDDNAVHVRKLLSKYDTTDDYLISESSRVTTRKTRILAAKQQVIRYDEEMTLDISMKSQTKLFEMLEPVIANYKVIILSDYGKGVLTSTLAKNIITLANSHNIKVLVDPKGSDYSKYYGAYLLTPNTNEIKKAFGIHITSDTLKHALTVMKETVGLTKSLITLSEDGIAVYDTSVRIHPTKAKEVFDVTGAGDTVVASLAVKLLETEDIDEVITFANVAAGIVVGKVGSATVTLEEINSHKHSTQDSVKTKEQIKDLCSKFRRQAKTIVFTNGCFDILHLGHVQYLEKAKQCGDILIVGINTNDSIKRLKGESRPVNDEYDRAYVLSACAAVDYVVLFDEDTPYELIKVVQPDVLVKGADYKDKNVVGSDIAKRTTLIEFVEGKSTTNIINKIKQ